MLGAYGFTIEARPTGGGLNGFSPPASEIQPAAEEITAAYLVMAELRTQPLRFVLPESSYANFQQDESRAIVFSVLGALNNPSASGVKVFARQGDSGSFTEIKQCQSLCSLTVLLWLRTFILNLVLFKL